MNSKNKMLFKSLNRQIFNPTVIKNRQFDCHIATAKQCGTHWIKYMLSLVLCEIHNLPPPDHIMENNLIGHTKVRPKYAHLPQIAVTHSHPHYLLRVPNIIKTLDLPKFLILVRDPRDILVSAYEKAKGEYLNNIMKTPYDASFSQFLRSPIEVQKPFADIWSIMLFFNAWEPILGKHEEETVLLHYEDLKKDTHLYLKKMCDFIGIKGVTDEVISNAIKNSSRKKMKTKLDPNEDQADKSVNLEVRSFKDWYSDEDKEFVHSIFTVHLKNPLGYDLQDWS